MKRYNVKTCMMEEKDGKYILAEESVKRVPRKDEKPFIKELTALVKKYSLDNFSATPDFILGDYLVSCLEIFGESIVKREEHFGRYAKGAETKTVTSSASEVGQEAPGAKLFSELKEIAEEEGWGAGSDPDYYVIVTEKRLGAAIRRLGLVGIAESSGESFVARL